MARLAVAIGLLGSFFAQDLGQFIERHVDQASPLSRKCSSLPNTVRANGVGRCSSSMGREASFSNRRRCASSRLQFIRQLAGLRAKRDLFLLSLVQLQPSLVQFHPRRRHQDLQADDVLVGVCAKSAASSSTLCWTS